jgi:hypothetical protein
VVVAKLLREYGADYRPDKDQGEMLLNFGDINLREQLHDAAYKAINFQMEHLYRVKPLFNTVDG